MSRIVVVVLAILGGCSASPVGEESCKNFLKDSKFYSTTLDGTWTVVYYWPLSTIDLKTIFHYRALSPEQVTAYENEMSASYPAVSWEKVKYEMILNRTKSGEISSSDSINFLVEIVDDVGNINTIPSGDLYNTLKKTQAVKTSRFAYKRVGDYMAVKFCDGWGEDAYLTHKGTEHDAEEVERVASGIRSTGTISNRRGAVAAFLMP